MAMVNYSIIQQALPILETDNSGFILRRKNKIADKRNFIFGTTILQSGERDRIFILFSPPLIESVHHFPLIRLFLRHSHKNDDDDDDDDDDDGRFT